MDITREESDRLHRQVWGFWVTATPGGDIKVYLQTYVKQERPTTRHGYLTLEAYSRIDRREASIQNVQQVPQPADVRTEVLQALATRTSVLISDGRDVEAPFGGAAIEDWRKPLHWEPVPYGRGNVEAFVDVHGLGRYLVSRAGPGSREFYVRLNGGPVIHRGTSDDCKRWVQLAVDQHRLKQQGL